MNFPTGSVTTKGHNMKFALIKKLRKAQAKHLLSIGGEIGDGWVMIPEGMEGVVRMLRAEGTIWGLWQE